MSRSLYYTFLYFYSALSLIKCKFTGAIDPTENFNPNSIIMKRFKQKKLNKTLDHFIIAPKSISVKQDFRNTY